MAMLPPMALPPAHVLAPLALATAGLALVARRQMRRQRTAAAVKKTFQGKVVWVTGASSGIGRALALAFAEQGAKLVLSARREAELQQVAEECAQAFNQARAEQQAGGTSGSGAAVGNFEPLATDAVAKVLPFDLSAEPKALAAKGAQAAALWAASSSGGVDILVNNGGISSRSPAEETSLEVDARLMAVDYLAPVALTKGVLPAMLTRRAGHVVVISSVQGRLAIPFRTSYAAAKHALHGYFESLRAEVADRGVKVTLVLPGYVKTSLSVNAVTGSGASYAKMDATTAQGMEPADLARAILEAVATGENEVLACDLKTKLAILARALIPDTLAKYMASRAKKGWKELRKP